MIPLIPIKAQEPQRRSPAKSDRPKLSGFKRSNRKGWPAHRLLANEPDPYLRAVMHAGNGNLALDRARNLCNALSGQNQKVPRLVAKAGRLIKKVVSLVFRKREHVPGHKAPR